MKNGKQLCVGNKYWYLLHYEDCPVCGKFLNWRERVYDRPKPDDKKDRIKYSYLNCYCYLGY